MSRQKAKGNGFERDIAKKLTEIFDLPFTRTFGSGAFLGGKNAHRRAGVSSSIKNASLGDIACPVEAGWNLIIECKSYANINFNGILQGYCDKLNGWISEVRYDAEGKQNHIVCFKIDRAGIYLVLPYNHYYVEKLHKAEVTYTVYPYYEYNEQNDETYLAETYCVLDFDTLSGVYNNDFPDIQTVLKEYIEYLAKMIK